MEERNMYLKCKIRKNGKISKCERVDKECKTYKETGVGLQGPISNVKRVCEIDSLKDLFTKW